MEAHEFEHCDIQFLAWEITNIIMKKLEDDQKWAERRKNEAAVKIAERRLDPKPEDIINFEYNKGRQQGLGEAECYINEMRRNIASELLTKYAKAKDAKDAIDKAKAEKNE